jgi:hypothetical protein
MAFLVNAPGVGGWQEAKKKKVQFFLFVLLTF